MRASGILGLANSGSVLNPKHGVCVTCYGVLNSPYAMRRHPLIENHLMKPFHPLDHRPGGANEMLH